MSLARLFLQSERLPWVTIGPPRLGGGGWPAASNGRGRRSTAIPGSAWSGSLSSVV